MATDEKVKHTPGPWKVKAAEFKGGNVVAYEIIMSRPEISQPNADLISAAPELAEALLAILRVCTMYDVGKANWVLAEAALKRAGLL